MSSTTLSPGILPSPFISLDQIIISLVYSADAVEWGQNFSLFLVPESSTLYPSSVLGWLYAYLLKNPQITRIVYFMQDDIIEWIIPSDISIEFVLWTSLVYDTDYYQNFEFCIKEQRKDFYIDSLLRSSHVLYSRILENIKLCPLVLPRNILKDTKIYDWLLSYMKSIENDSSTVCVFFDSHTFSIDEDSQVSISKEKLYGIGNIFYDSISSASSSFTIRIYWNSTRSRWI
jgi:hypothetical protein